MKPSHVVLSALARLLMSLARRIDPLTPASLSQLVGEMLGRLELQHTTALQDGVRALWSIARGLHRRKQKAVAKQVRHEVDARLDARLEERAAGAREQMRATFEAWLDEQRAAEGLVYVRSDIGLRPHPRRGAASGWAAFVRCVAKCRRLLTANRLRSAF
jgi:hypothetical protein